MLLMLLLGAVALAVAVAFAFAVAVAVTDTFRMGGVHESYKALYGLIRPYPSLSFGEYNSRRGSFFTPLGYFLAGHYLDP